MQGCNPSEDLMKAQGDTLIETGMAAAGYIYGTQKHTHDLLTTCRRFDLRHTHITS